MPRDLAGFVLGAALLAWGLNAIMCPSINHTHPRWPIRLGVFLQLSVHYQRPPRHVWRKIWFDLISFIASSNLRARKSFRVLAHFQGLHRRPRFSCSRETSSNR